MVQSSMATFCGRTDGEIFRSEADRLLSYWVSLNPSFVLIENNKPTIHYVKMMQWWWNKRCVPLDSDFPLTETKGNIQ